MKILKLYAKEADRYISYGTESPLMKEIKSLYDCDEVVLQEGCPEHEYADMIREYDILLTMWNSPHVPNELADRPGKLRYICNITGEVARWIDKEIIESPYITVTNWGNAPAFGIAEGALALLLAVMKNIPSYIKAAREEWSEDDIPYAATQASLYQKRIGIYGIGAIGSKFIELLKPFEPIIYGYDPFAAVIPEKVTMVNSLEELFDMSQIVVIHAGLNDATRGSVTGELLAKLPDGGIIINTARGQIVDYEALKAELMSGRLRAGLDMVTERNMPKQEDPIRMLDNVILSSHHIGVGKWGVDPEALDIAAVNCLDNLARYSRGEELKFVISPSKYKIST